VGRPATVSADQQQAAAHNATASKEKDYGAASSYMLTSAN
jgi:hypothetical protein